MHSKASCWSALDRAIRMSEALELPAPVERWARERDACRAAIEAEGRGGDGRCYRRSFGSDEMDSSLLLLPRLGYVGWADDAMVATVDAVRERLEDGRGLLRRYAAPDGLRGREHAFVACTFWLAEALARQGRLDEARSAFRRGCGTANDLWLFAEEYDGAEDRMAGNFPQGLSHYSFLSAAVALAEAEGRGG